jgi:glycosyltransferase involved in cell wall biosynthesis
MLISVVIPNYNYSAFLSKTVESVVRQTYSRLELIIVDDASSDDSRGLITSLVDSSRWRFERAEALLLEEHGGKLYALNRAIPRASGEVIIILDSDDYLADDYVTLTVGRLLDSKAADDRVAFVYTDCWLVDSSDQVLSQGHSASFSGALLQTSSYIPECAPTLASVLKDMLPFDERIKVGTKHHKWRKIVAAGWEGRYLAEPLFYYRMHQHNISGIGRKVLAGLEQSRPDLHILSGYWPTAVTSQDE